MLYLYLILFFLKNFLNCEKIDVRIQILKRHKLTNPPPPHPPPPPPPPSKRCNDVFHSKNELRVIPNYLSPNLTCLNVLMFPYSLDLRRRV